MKVKNNNENNNIIVLDFGDYEIQKKKKKKPKKKVNNKKKAVDELKETLQQFDAVLNEAKEKNIEIPKELGELPVNIEDINTIRELNELNADLQQRIINIRELIESGGEPQIPSIQTIDPRMFGESGFLQGMQPIVAQRQQHGLVEPTTSTTETQTQPTQPILPPKDTDLEKVRQQLKKQEKEIIDRLPPDKREEALKKLKEQASKKPVDTSKEDAEKMGKEDLVKPSLEAGFQIIKPDDKRDVKILGESFESPIGLYDEWEAAKGFIERSSNLGKEDESLPNVVNISVKDFEDFKKEQKAKLDSYTIYVKNLNPTQLKSIQGEMEVPTRISKEILNVYKTDPKKVLEQFYSSKFGRNIKLNIGESGKLPKPKPKPPRQPKGFSGVRVSSTPTSVEAEKILEDMLQEIQNLPPDTDFVPKNFSKFRKSQMRTVLEKIKEAADKNDEEVEFLKGPNPIETFINKYASNKSKLYRGPLLGKIITQYKKVVGTGSYRFQKKRTEAEEQEEQKVSIVNPDMPSQTVGTGGSIGPVEFLSDVNL